MSHIPTSSYVLDLLARIAMRSEDDAAALQALALRTLNANPVVFTQIPGRDGPPMYLMNQTVLSMFLVDSGLDDWFDAQWLALDANGALTADRPLHLKGHPQDEAGRLALANRIHQLAKHVWREMTISAKNPVRLGDGTEHLAIRGESVGVLLSRARDTAQGLAIFREVSAERKADAMRSEFYASEASATIPYSIAAPLNRNRRSPK